VLIADDFPELSADLVAALTCLDVDDLSNHCEALRRPKPLVLCENSESRAVRQKSCLNGMGTMTMWKSCKRSR
jgi:hypothetical protein